MFIGITTSDYGQIVRSRGVERSDVYSATGNASNAAAGRIAFTFGFQGPTVAVDTACSSSLVAVHLACRALRNGEADLALAGGVNVVLSPDAMILFSKWGMLAPDGKCKTFDADADGFVRAEGCAMIALNGCRPRRPTEIRFSPSIRGTAVNQDGRSSGLTVPDGPAQQAVLRRALADARLQPNDIDYVEAHGTGTPLGDPIELEALGTVMGVGREASRPLLVGSVKTNLGHTEAASGLAGLLKVVMAMRHEAIPPHLHFTRPNPGIDWERFPLRVTTALTPWMRGPRARRAGVSSFGFSGTNAHVILEEAPATAPVAESVNGPQLVPLSARDADGMRRVAERLATFVDANLGVPLADIALTAGTGRSHLGHRIAVVADDASELARALRSFTAGDVVPGLSQGSVRAGQRPKIAFLFTGQGAQYAGMGRALYDSQPVFRAAIDRAATILQPLLPRPLLEVLFPAEANATPLSETAYTQPALFALEFALAELWASWGVTPSVVLGHSVGEYVAACVAGVMRLEDGLALIAERGRLMQALPAGGAMAAVFADEARVASRVAPRADCIAIAALNGPEETVISGDASAVAELVAAFAAEGVKSRALDVSHAFHSPRLDPMLDALERRAASIAFAVPCVPLISNLTGEAFPAGVAPDAAYWRRHAREPVRFAASLEALQSAGVTAVVEIGPHPTLLALAARSRPTATWTVAASLRRGRDDRREMLGALGALYSQGASVQWSSVAGNGNGRRIALPTYSFQRQRHWIDATPAAQTSAGATVGHPLLGDARELATSPGTYVWETDISLATHPWLTDHRVQHAAIVPATAYIEMAFAAAAERWGNVSIAAREIENLKPLILLANTRRRLQTALVLRGDSADFSVHSREGSGPFIGHVTARLAIGPRAEDASGGAALDAARIRCTAAVAGEVFYSALSRKGNQWGPAFQGMKEVWLGDDEAVGRIEVPSSLLGEVGRYRFHPAVSDSCGHPLVATVPFDPAKGPLGGAFVGGGVGEVRFYAPPRGTVLWTHATLRQPAHAGERVVMGDVRVYEDSGKLVSETLDARLWYLDDDGNAGIDDWFYGVRWTRAESGQPSNRAPRPGTWLVIAEDASVAGVAEQLAHRRADARTVVVSYGATAASDGDRATIRRGQPDDVRQAIESTDAAAVILLSSRVADTPTSATARAETLLHVHRGLADVGARARPRLWIVTADAQPVLTSDTVATPFAAALWGAGRTISVEHTELWGGLIDLPSTTADSEAAEQLSREIAGADAEDAVAFRDGQRHVARLQRTSADASAGSVAVRADATYFVTGGLGGLGLAMAKWLVERGARHLLLVGRTPLPARDVWATLDPGSPAGRRCAAVAALEAKGAAVEVAAIDVAVEGLLERLLQAREVRGEFPVRGVIHAAGTLAFRPFDAESVDTLRDMLAAKIDGAWRLHNLFGRDALDFFILCSSTSTLLRSPLLGAYAAGNAFLDALAHHRRAKGLTALAVNWGTWGEVGMAVEGGRSKGSMLQGMNTMSTSNGLLALERLLGASAVQAAVMPVDWPGLVRGYPAFATDPFLAALTAGVTVAPVSRSIGSAASLVRDASGDEQAALMLSYVRGEVARTLGMMADRLDPALPLSSLGFDSLMAVQLKNQIEADFGVVVPMIQFLQGPSVEGLAPSILALLGDASAAQQRDDNDEWEAGSI